MNKCKTYCHKSGEFSASSYEVGKHAAEGWEEQGSDPSFLVTKSY